LGIQQSEHVREGDTAFWQTRAEQLQRALDSRVVIEQAKGVLAERFGCGTDEAFEVLRRAARSNQRKIHDLANEVVASAAGRSSARAQRANGEVR